MTPSTDDLAAAVAADVLTAVEAERLRVFLEGRRRGEEPALDAPDREDVRFVRGFHDVFMSVGLLVLLFGMRFALLTSSPITSLLGHLTAAAVIWALAEFFTLRQRLVLPSIVLASGFVCFIVLAAGSSTSHVGALNSVPLASSEDQPMFALSAATAGAAAAVLFRLRFHLPFSTSLVAGGLLAVAIAGLNVAFPDVVAEHWRPLLLAAGLVSFAAAMWFDLSDRERTTLRADNAFWLHLLAAPLIVHSLIYIAIGDPGRPSSAQAAIVIAIVLALAYVALVVDRRALLMSGLVYFGVAIGTLITRTEIDKQAIFAITLVVLGALVVSLGAGWRPARRLALKLLPVSVRTALPAAA